MRKTSLVFLALLLLATSSPVLTPRQKALHALNRLGFGPRPGDVEKVMQMGVDKWIDQQLHPERIADAAVDARLRQLPTMQMSNADILKKYYAPVLMARKEAKANSGADNQQEMRRELMKDIPYDQRPQRVMEDLLSQRIIRAAESDRQLNEVMVDFWMNHFNVFAGKGLDRFLLTSYERDTIRPHIWGRFEDLLRATAKSPAMLFYLDNARSVAAPENRPQRVARFGRFRAMPAQQNAKQKQGGLNENYAREIMELHTLGVDGGYTQKDVTELARVFTGWTITRPQDRQGEAAEFMFRPQLHDIGSKTVLGVHFRPGGGMEEGEQMIHFLAHQPATAHHIALQLCQRLVSDEPPPALVDRVAKRFLATDGDLRETVKAVVTSPEFWSPATYRAKVKTPFEYVISATRALGMHVDQPAQVARALQQIGEPLYGSQPPTGYSDKAEAWMNTGALLNRMNFAVDLAKRAPLDPNATVASLAVTLAGDEISGATCDKIKEKDPHLIAGLILGSPEFQRQ